MNDRQRPDLHWSTRTDRRRIGADGGLRHVLVDVEASRRERDDDLAERAPLNLGLVIDVSGSMMGEPLDAAIRAASGVVELLTARDRLTVVSFADRAHVHCDRLRCDDAGRARAIGKIRRLEVRGCTNLSGGWLTGCERVAEGQERKPGVQSRVILLSDGMANRGICDPHELGHHAAELRRRGMQTSCVGIGDDYSPTQLQAIAEHGGGRLHDAPLGEDIVSVLLGELGEIFATAADDVQLEVVAPRGVELTVLGPYVTDRAGDTLTVHLGALAGGASRQLALQVGLPPAAPGERVDLALRPRWRDGQDGDPVRGRPLSLHFTVTSEAEAGAEVIDVAVGKVVAGLWQRHVLMASTLLNTAERLDEADATVRDVLSRYTDYCADVPGTTELVRELRDHGDEVREAMNPRRSKDRYMEARLAMLGETDHRSSRAGGRRPRGI